MIIVAQLELLLLGRWILIYLIVLVVVIRASRGCEVRAAAVVVIVIILELI